VTHLITALRLSYGTVSRLPRVASVPISYGPYLIPAHTPLSTNHYAAHHDERIFPDSHAFAPERWLNNPRAPVLDTYGTEAERSASSVEDGERQQQQQQPQDDAVSAAGGQGDENEGRLLSRYMVAFSRGTRQCIGMHLAWAESYLMMASIIRRCDLEIFETRFEDVGFLRDFFVPHSAPDARGLRVLVKDVIL
jgi:cytochrome P450